MKYQYIRLFLLEQARPPILEITGNVPPALSRQSYLQRVFGGRIDFQHRTNKMVYIHIGTEYIDEQPILLGRIGRTIEIKENAPPENEFEETTHMGWKAANILLDTRDFYDGQKIAFQHHLNVGKPFPIINSLVSQINDNNKDSGWRIDTNLLTDKKKFWDAVSENKGEITSAEFTFVTPNVLRVQSSLNENLKKKRRVHNAARVQETLSNPDGNLNLETDDIEDYMDYISKGGGKAKLRSGKNVVYDSENDQVVVDMKEDEPLDKEKKSTWRRFVDAMFP